MPSPGYKRGVLLCPAQPSSVQGEGCRWPWVPPARPCSRGQIQKLCHPGKGGGGGVPASLQPFPTTPAFRRPGFPAWAGKGAGSGSGGGTAPVASGTVPRGPGAAAVSGNLTRFCYATSISGTLASPSPSTRQGVCAVHHPYVCRYIYPCLLSRPRVRPFVASPQLGSRCYSHLLPLAAGTEEGARGSLRLRATGAPGSRHGAKRCVQRCNAIRETRCNAARAAAPAPLVRCCCQNLRGLAQLDTKQSLSGHKRERPDLRWDTGAGQGTTLSPSVPHCHQRPPTACLSPGKEDPEGWLLPGLSCHPRVWSFCYLFRRSELFNAATRALAVPASTPGSPAATRSPLCQQASAQDGVPHLRQSHIQVPNRHVSPPPRGTHPKPTSAPLPGWDRHSPSMGTCGLRHPARGRLGHPKAPIGTPPKPPLGPQTWAGSPTTPRCHHPTQPPPEATSP